MGNGNNRHRRGGGGARQGPHRGGAGNGSSRSATHLMPPGLTAAEGAQVGDGETAAAERRPEALESAPEPTPEPAPESTSVEEEATEPAEPSAPLPEAVSAAVSEVASEPEPTPEPEPQRPAPRGRFERFYVPGQGMRADHSNGARPATESAADAATPAGARSNGSNGAHAATPPIHQPSTPDATSGDEDEVNAPRWLREDVRGTVGGMIDALHELFSHDRSIASQGGVSRCGICYLHFPASELIYREAEGFYVCESCGHALGSGRIAMVRRQQRL